MKNPNVHFFQIEKPDNFGDEHFVYTFETIFSSYDKQMRK